MQEFFQYKNNIAIFLSFFYNGLVYLSGQASFELSVEKAPVWLVKGKDIAHNKLCNALEGSGRVYGYCSDWP